MGRSWYLCPFKCVNIANSILEVSNNGYRDGSSGLNNTEDSFHKFGGVSVDQRKMNAVRAYFEWMP
jgi:phosphodiesterase/alkaline phosphatase D-like protein